MKGQGTCKFCFVGHIDETPHYQFGQHVIGCKQVFYKTALSFAFVNIKPVLPGRILQIVHVYRIHWLIMTEIDPQSHCLRKTILE